MYTEHNPEQQESLRGHIDIVTDQPLDLGSFRTQDPSIITEARQLIASVYRRLGFVTDEEIDQNTQTLTSEADPYVDHSEYYVRQRTVDGELSVTSTVRKILFDKELKEKSFPVLKDQDKFDPEYVDEIYSTGLENCVEISALAKNTRDDQQEPLKLYRAMWQDALRRKGTYKEEKLWLMAASPSLFTTFEIYFNGAIKRIGPDLDYPGQEAVPAVLNPVKGFIELVENIDSDPELQQIRKMVVEFLVDGLQKDELGEELNTVLEENGFTLGDDEIVHSDNYQKPVAYEIDKTEENDSEDEQDDHDDNDQSGLTEHTDKEEKRILERLKKRKPEIIGSLGLLGYTALRTEAVRRGISPDGDTDWRVFLGLEVATTPPYVWGMGDLIRSLKSPEDYTKKRLAAATALASSSFLSPYVYVATTGGESLTNPYVSGGIAAFFGMGILSAANQVRQARKARKIS